MIGKIIKAESFSKSVSYAMEKEKGQLLETKGVMNDSVRNTIDSFEIQAQLRPTISKPVGHISLSFSAEDADRLTDQFMLQLAKEYMQAMKIKNTQYIIVRHHDAEHPHCHIVYNRINNQGEVIPSKHNYRANTRICKEMKDKYGLTYGEGKDKVNVHRLREPTRTKYEIYHAVKDSLQTANDWKSLQRELQKHQIELIPKYKGKTGEVQGISFSKNNYSFKGSQVDKSCSYSKLSQRLGDCDNDLDLDKDHEEDFSNEKTKKYSTSSQMKGLGLGIFGMLAANDTSNEQESSKKNRRKR